MSPIGKIVFFLDVIEKSDAGRVCFCFMVRYVLYSFHMYASCKNFDQFFFFIQKISNVTRNDHFAINFANAITKWIIILKEQSNQS